MQLAEKKQLLSLLDELRQTVEELLLAGLTTASKSTIERIGVAFKEASRMKLLRLGMTLRLVNEDISRFTGGSALFSARRLAFFLSRTFMLAEGLRKALEAGDDAAYQRLMFTPPARPFAMLKVVTLGVGKRAVVGASAAFEFRLRVVEDAAPAPLAGATDTGAALKPGDPLIWSCVFPMPDKSDLPPEAFLHLPQKQKFKPSLFLEKKVIEITQCAVSPPSVAGGVGRLSLSETSAVKTAAAYAEWNSFWHWSLDAAAQRLKDFKPTPMDLDIELQEEIFLHDWAPGSIIPRDEFDVLPLQDRGLFLEARLDRGLSGKPLNGTLARLAEKKKRPALFGTAHYEACRVVFQPLTAMGKDGPEYLTVSPEKISQAELVKAMKFT